MAGRDPLYPTYPSDEELANILSQDHPKSDVVPTSWGMEDLCDETGECDNED